MTKASLPDGRDYLSEPYDTELAVYPPVVNSDDSRVPVKNSNPHEKSKARILDGNFRFNSISDESDPSYTVTCPPTTSDSSIKPVSNPLRVEASPHNGVTIYDISKTACRLSAIVDEFDMWGEKDRWMAIPLKEGWDESMEWHGMAVTSYPKGLFCVRCIQTHS
jgi:hypothetical protein